MATPGDVSIHAIPGIPEVTEGFDLGAAICAGAALGDGDLVAISQKAVSKAEGRVVELDTVTPGAAAESLATELGKDPRLVELILGESRTVLRKDPDRSILIVETVHGFVCANAGIDTSNVSGSDSVVLLPLDSDRSARRIRSEIEAAAGVRPAVLVTDSFGRAWRLGQSEVTIGCAGIAPLDDWRGRADRAGMTLAATNIAVADQVAAAADLARTKTSGTPAVRVRGLERLVTREDGPGCGTQLRAAGDDLFR